ncbi:multidrug effflux MFS transporter [Actinomycetes bacterium KLBMP 9797]
MTNAMPGDQLSRRRRLGLVAVLGALIAIGPLTIDLYLPALPAIRADLATTSAGVQLTLTGTMLGMAIGNLLVGPLSDMLGRRGPLLAGLLLHVVASALCAVTPDIRVLAALRVLQGLAVAAAGVIATAVLRDLFSGAAFARLLSRLLLLPTAAPILAPSLGGIVLRWTRWEGVFVVLAAVGVLLIAVVAVWLPETLAPDRRRPARLATTTRAYRTLARDRTFVRLVLVAGLAMAALLAYVAGSSFVFQAEYGLSEQRFALLFGAGAAGLVAATQLNVWLLRRYPPQRILTAAMVLGAVAGLALVGFATTGLGGLPALLAALWLMIATVGLVFPNAPALAMSRHGEIAGTAAALLGAVQFGLGGLAAPMVGVLGAGKVAMAVVVAGAMLAAAAVAIAAVRLPRGGRPLDADVVGEPHGTPHVPHGPRRGIPLVWRGDLAGQGDHPVPDTGVDAALRHVGR